MPITRLAIIQARMSSSRLPGKVLMDINGRPMLQHVIERAMRAKNVDGIVVATTNDPADDRIEQYCNGQGIPYYRGSLTDVLDRYYRTSVQFHADVIIRLTADCPLLDPEVLDLTVSAYDGKLTPPVTATSTLTAINNPQITPPFSIAANRLPPPWKRTLPIGMDVEVCSFAALESAWKLADQPYQREHVMPYLYEGVEFSPVKLTPGIEWYIESGITPRGTHVALLNHQPDLGALRWTVDTPEDLDFARQVYAHFGAYEVFGWKQVLALLESEPSLAEINASVTHKTAFDIDQRISHS